jgi:ribosome-associated protein
VKKNLIQKTFNETIHIAKECLVHFDEKKAIDPLLMDLRKVNSYLDFFLIATGNSQIHCRSLARDIVKFLNARGIKEYGRHDLNSEWIILDFGDLIVHIFTEETRSYYQLEKLWADAEKIGSD